MPKKKLIMGTWLMTMSLLSLTAFTMVFVAQMRISLLLYSYSALLVTQIVSLLLFLIGKEKLKHIFVRILYRICCVASILVIPAFVFILMGLMSQYHANIRDAKYVAEGDFDQIRPTDQTTVYQTDSLYIFYPEYSNISLACGERPSPSDASITWCSGAAFQHSTELGFSDVNIEGYHASNGIFSDSPYVKDGMAAVVFYDGTYQFVFEDRKEAVQNAAEEGGSGFMQYTLIRDGQIDTVLNMQRVRSFRALAELNGQICIIDSIDMTHFDDFLEELQNLGVQNAVYMDMGAGWNYSWYRTETGTVKNLFCLKVPWSHNWIVFRK